jgi:hypothetical protein
MASPSAISCKKRDRLIHLYAEAARVHNDLSAARMAAQSTGSGSPSSEQVAEAQMHQENARFVLLKHMDDHGCGAPDTVPRFERP